MIRRIFKNRSLYIVLLFALLTQGCFRARLNAPSALPTVRDIQSVATEVEIESPTPTPTIKVETPLPTAALIVPTETSLPKVTISAEKGNLYIRRGPGMAYNQIGVLHKDTSADVIARDVLSKWVQVVIPDSDKTGWVSLQTDYSKLNGVLSSLPDFTFTDWPVPAYLYNCTEHDMYIMPGELILTSYFTHPNNQIWLNPGTYTVYDDTLPKRPEVRTVEIREGVSDAIVVDGLGNHHKCP
ncbi:MAG: SH3 domain-containing protein [Chloroflexi bacterium]|nr:SH3 domain-containing protein [Chloroflexota bacterium]